MNEAANEFAQKALARLVVALPIAAAVWFWYAARPIPHPPGVLVAQDPVQTDCASERLGEVNGYSLQKLADYRLRARVLGAKRYHDTQSELAPLDLALGWGPMSDSAVLEKLTISQGNHFFFYEWREEPPIPRKEMAVHSANTHVIPANRAIGSFLKHLKTGALVELRGSLVVATRGSFVWRSSLTREDTGNGACELLYVTAAESLPPK